MLDQSLYVTTMMSPTDLETVVYWSQNLPYFDEMMER